MDFDVLPSGHITLTNLTTPASFLGQDGDLAPLELHIEDGKFADVPGTPHDMKGAMVFPCFVDMHTHLDKGHIWTRTPNPDGTFQGALESVGADRAALWTAEDVTKRMDFSLRCAYAHGTRAIRTHLDSVPPQDAISWPVFRDMREVWKGWIDLQAVCLVGCEGVTDAFENTADLVADAGGVLGMVTYPIPDLKDRLMRFLDMAAARGLEADFHVDETMDPNAETLRLLAETVMETGFDARVVVGHCCSLSTQDEARAAATLDLVAEAGIHAVSLPMCNLYLQDRHAGRTPRGRGITLVHEMVERGIPVSFASDNTRDPFYAYGDMDMLEVMREATRIGHLDHSRLDWAASFSTRPAETCGFANPGFAAGSPADAVIFKARQWTELLSRPQADRIVLRGGKQIDRTLPDYAELDPLMRSA